MAATNGHEGSQEVTSADPERAAPYEPPAVEGVTPVHDPLIGATVVSLPNCCA